MNHKTGDKGDEQEFLRCFEKKVRDTVKEHKLFSKKDRIIAACSGGKDSTTVLHILNKLGFNVEAFTVDAIIGNYTAENIRNLKSFCKEKGIKLSVISFREEFGASLCYIRQALSSRGVKLNSCTVCGTLRRYLLNKAAKSMGADCIVTGHNLDDEAQSIIMNMLRNNLEVSARLGPKTGALRSRAAGEGRDVKERKSFAARVKPLYFCPEAETERYSRIMGFPVKYEPCPCRTGSYRNKVRKMLDRLEQDNPLLKRKIVEGFSRILPALKKKYSSGVQMYCTNCGEPSKGKECRTCEILSNLHYKRRRNKKTKK